MQTDNRTFNFSTKKFAPYLMTRARFSLIALVISLALAVGLVTKTMHVRSQLTEASKASSNHPASCSRILVTFKSTASIQDVIDLLWVLESTIASGPFDDGGFEINVPAFQLDRIIDDYLEVDSLVLSAKKLSHCRN